MLKLLEICVVAAKLNTGDKLDFPKQLNIKTTLAINGLDPTIMPTGWTGGIRFIDGYSSGNMGFGPDGTTINAQIEKNGDITGNKLISKGILRLLDGGSMYIDNGNINIMSNTDPVHIKLLNANKLGNDEVFQWSISNMKSNSNNKNDNKLSFSRTPANNISTYTPSLELYDSGDVNIPGNLTVNNIITKKNRARFIRVGNMKSYNIFTEAEYKRIGEEPASTTDSTSTTAPIIEKYWTLIEIRVFDDTGTNIALNKDVKLKEGEMFNSRYNPKHITNGKMSLFDTDIENLPNNTKSEKKRKVA
jgi:hypothetical protein